MKIVNNASLEAYRAEVKNIVDIVLEKSRKVNVLMEVGAHLIIGSLLSVGDQEEKEKVADCLIKEIQQTLEESKK